MNVLLIVTEKLPVPAIRGGAIQTYIDGVTPYLAAHHDVTILGVDDPDLPAKEKRGTVRYRRIPGKLYDVYEKGVVRYLKKRSFDLIHIFNRPRLVPAVRKVAPNARIVLSMHNDMFLPNKITKDEANTAIAEVERIVTVSNYVGERIAADYPEAANKLTTIYSGVDVDRYDPVKNSSAYKSARAQLRKEHSLQKKDVILFVGRLSPKKGADILVQSMGYVAERHKNAALVLVGSRWYSDDEISDYVAYVRALAARCPIPVVTTGFVAPNEVHKWFWAGDVFVCPSQWEEPLARVHYEAMAAGLPIVTTKRGGNPEVIDKGRNGVIVNQPWNPKAFANRLTPLLANSAQRREMGEVGMAMAKERFRWDRVANDILDVWGR